MNKHTPATVNTKRRTVVKGIAGLPLATLLADKTLASAVAETLEEVTITTEMGRSVTASLAMPDVLPAPTLLLIHEWWGLNDEVKTVAAEYAKEGYIALAIDLHKGQVATKPADAVKLTMAVKDEEAHDTLRAWMSWLRAHPDTNGKLGTLGWCFGGKWSLNASLLEPADATVVYYGNVQKTAEEVASLQGDLLGHFGTLDKFIPPKMVEGFEAALKEAGKTYTIHMYEADHAFSNPTSASYDSEDAKLSWARSLEFLEAKLKN